MSSNLCCRRKKNAIPAARRPIAPTATPTPIPVFAPPLNPLVEEGAGVPVLLAVDVGVVLVLLLVIVPVLVAVGNSTIVKNALAVGSTVKVGLSAPYPVEVFGLGSKLQLDVPCHTRSTSWGRYRV
jgi:hypothetical protein